MRLAPLRLRLLATLVNSAVVISGMAAVIGVAIAGVLARGRGHDEPGADSSGDGTDGPGGASAVRELRPSPHLLAALRGAGAGLAAAGRNWRGVGYRVVGLRRVDARTGGLVSARSALVALCFDQARQEVTNQLVRPLAQRRRDRVDASSGAHDINAFAGCGWLLAGPISSEIVLALGTSGGRTIRDRITGTVVIVDRGR